MVDVEGLTPGAWRGGSVWHCVSSGVVCGSVCRGGSMWHMLDGCAQALSCRDGFKNKINTGKVWPFALALSASLTLDAQ